MSESLFQVKEPFKIFVGDNSVNKVLIGFLEYGKSSIKSGTSTDELEYSGGDDAFPNYWEGWGRRVIDGKANEDGVPIEVTNQKYVGEVEFLEPSDRKGYTIFCRYVKGQYSLDYQYQISRLGLITKEEDEKNLMIMLARGEHKIDPAKDSAYALAIKIHPMNQSSKFKTKKFSNYIYKEVNVFETTKSDVKALDVKFEATKHIKDHSSTFARLKTLHTVLSDGKEIKYDATDENSLYNALMLYADQSPDEVLRLIAKHKEKTSALIEKGKAYNAFDCTKNGIIAVGLIKKEILVSDAKGKGDDMLQWLFENCLEPKIFDAINRLHELSAKNFK